MEKNIKYVKIPKIGMKVQGYHSNHKFEYSGTIRVIQKNKIYIERDDEKTGSGPKFINNSTNYGRLWTSNKTSFGWASSADSGYLVENNPKITCMEALNDTN